MLDEVVGEAPPVPDQTLSPLPTEGEGAVTWARDSILFSSCNEDTNSELRAFGDLQGKRVLCISAGGGRVLNLLHARPAEIWAVDLNPAQNFLLELKVAAMRALDHEGYLRFLGVHACANRLATYQTHGIASRLSNAAQRFFAAQPQLIQAGILFQGRLERYLCRLSKLLRWVQPFGVRRLFACEDLTQQRALMRKLDNALFRNIAETACRRGVLRAFSGDPGFYRYVPPEVALHKEIYAGMLAHFDQHLARHNPLMQLVFFGRFIHEAALPHYLNAASYEGVKAALERVKLITLTSTVNDALERAGSRAFDAFSLSDISSYLDDRAHAQLFAATLSAARPGARLCSRSNIHHRPLLPEHASRIARDRELERELAIADHSCVHKFLIGTVR
jgi:S-adenosylmethionine-diacylglycerol 3-amino-3-carboxypropyl transferase